MCPVFLAITGLSARLSIMARPARCDGRSRSCVSMSAPDPHAGAPEPSERASVGADLLVSGRAFPLVSVFLSESYNTGWSARASFAFRASDPAPPAHDVLATLAAHGLGPGLPAQLRLRVAGPDGPLPGPPLRVWPSMIAALVPGEPDGARASCVLHLVDPVSYLAERPVWGAYRDVGVAGVVGAGLALALGADPRPRADVAHALVPAVSVRTRCRAALERLDYVLACGEPLGAWLAELLGALGLRAELFAGADGASVVLHLSDRALYRTGVRMHLVREGAPPPDLAAWPDGPFVVRARAAFAPGPLRAGLLDDPTQGAPRPLLSPGPVATVVAASSLDVDEASERALCPARARAAEALVVHAASSHPGWQPGCLLLSSAPLAGLSRWQMASVTHLVRDGRYDNDAVLLRADVAWHPPPVLDRASATVTAVVDGGPDALSNEPVARDRLGRVPVSFAFLPVPDLRPPDVAAPGAAVVLADYPPALRADYAARPEVWARTLAALEAGEYDDPYAPLADEALAEEERAERARLRALAASARAYAHYRALAPAPEAGAGDVPAPAGPAPDGASWPPRISLPVVVPAAGALHGVVVPHRHGDVCRVAVHGVFSAEVVGAQYRANRLVNADIAGAASALVVEHDFARAWTGMVFRRDPPSQAP